MDTGAPASLQGFAAAPVMRRLPAQQPANSGPAAETEALVQPYSPATRRSSAGDTLPTASILRPEPVRSAR